MKIGAILSLKHAFRPALFYWTDRREGGYAKPHNTEYSKTERTRAAETATRSEELTPPLRKTQIMCRRLDALDTIIPMCSFRFRLSWITKPRTLWERTFRVLDHQFVKGVAEGSL